MSTASDMMAAAAAIEASERQRDRNFGEACRRVIEHFCEGLRLEGRITSYAIERSEEHDVSLLRLDIDGTPRRWQIRDDELRMGGVDGLREWLQRIVLREVRDIVHRRGATSPHFREQAIDFHSGMRDEFMRSFEMHRDLLRQMSLCESDGAHHKAEKKAEDLFRAVAGQAAFEALNAGGSWPVKGSAGGEYELLKRASFCIRRVKDGAELCAVVPGVPLYDHLLGIKLMIEHDEPSFIKTANVAGRINAMPGGITWVDQDYDRRIGEAIRAIQVDEAMRTVNPPVIIGIDPAL